MGVIRLDLRVGTVKRWRGQEIAQPAFAAMPDQSKVLNSLLKRTDLGRFEPEDIKKSIFYSRSDFFFCNAIIKNRCEQT